jgi:hypothetical protein
MARYTVGPSDRFLVLANCQPAMGVCAHRQRPDPSTAEKV